MKNYITPGQKFISLTDNSIWICIQSGREVVTTILSGEICEREIAVKPFILCNTYLVPIDVYEWLANNSKTAAYLSKVMDINNQEDYSKKEFYAHNIHTKLFDKLPKSFQNKDIYFRALNGEHYIDNKGKLIGWEFENKFEIYNENPQ